ncbi:LysR family transcriptional regulator [Mesorhizobium sp. CGMCC 1.15528]|uniref:LysR family transcriptional regulator n=2 Tax=Phyllobacteriaceae TaxID=69277 RepID=A0A7C9RCW2_9HYPH|nr:LysR family transcriptional regulator [Mesorhizobium zhangyense]NGN43573.1 LysR family transcriptional regulator [Mesorhizobium zhangyense]
MPRHSLTDIDAVLAIARKGSFRAAALELGLSTTAISNAIGKIERRLGIRLFNRTTRSVSLTDAGRNFVDQVAPAMDDIYRAIDSAMSQQKTPSGTLRINAFAMAAREALSPLVLRFLRQYPQVHVDVVTEGRIIDIVAAGFDMGIRSADLIPSDMIAVPFGHAQSYAVVASPMYLKQSEKPNIPPDLLSLSCIRVRLPNGALFRWPFEKDGHSVQIDVKGPITLDEASLTRIAALDGVGIGLVWEADVREDIASGSLVRLLQDWTPALSPLCLYYPGRRNPSAAFKAFIEMARASARE